jgi:hypothetical protein
MVVTPLDSPKVKVLSNNRGDELRCDAFGLVLSGGMFSLAGKTKPLPKAEMGDRQTKKVENSGRYASVLLSRGSENN